MFMFIARYFFPTSSNCADVTLGSISIKKKKTFVDKLEIHVY